MNAADRIERLALIGFGEAARTFASGFGARRPAARRAYDRKTDEKATHPEMTAAYAAHRVDGAADPAGALAGAQAVLSLVTADQALAAAEAAAHLPPGAWRFDGNSCAPQTKLQAAELITAAGGRYVDMAIMAPVHPSGLAVPVRVSGPDCDRAVAVLQALGFSPEPAGEWAPPRPSR